MARWSFWSIWSPYPFFSTFQNISYFLYIIRMSIEKIRYLSLKMSPGEQNMYTLYFSDFMQFLTCWEISLYENLDSWTLNCHKIISDWDSTVILFVYSMWNLNLGLRFLISLNVTYKKGWPFPPPPPKKNEKLFSQKSVYIPTLCPQTRDCSKKI